jgi:polyribonucleotide nucleotidyltransferase
MDGIVDRTVHRVTLPLRDDELIIETGKIAKQANGSVMVKYKGSVVFCAATMSKNADLNLGYFPLQVNYSEKLYAAGKIPGGFIKRETRPHDKEILVSRLIDRPMRPLFPDGFRNEVQLIPTTLSADQINQPDILGMIGASAATHISDIPFNGPVGACRVGLVDGEFVLNPTFPELENSLMDLVVSGTHDAIMMIEGHAKELSEQQMLDAVFFAHEHIKELCRIQDELRKICGKEKAEVELYSIPEGLEKEFKDFAYDKLKDALNTFRKEERENNLSAVTEEIMEHFSAKIEDEKDLSKVKDLIKASEKDIVRKQIVLENKRVDGRKTDQLRPITCEVSLLPRTHGTGLFTRGETQALGVITLGTAGDEQRMDDIEGESKRHFMLHYNFPPYSVGETGRLGPVGRREIGHGYLAERSLQNVIPSKEDFPYTIRIVSEIMESNGSSSMASVCVGTLAMLDAGIPIKASVAGIALGLVLEPETKKYTILTDIQGIEDALGDMDFKVAGTKDGITGFQMDIKVEGITYEIMKEALDRAKVGRMQILDIMNGTLDKPREAMSEFAPKIISFSVPTEKIKDIIGPGGSVIRGIIEKTGVDINIEDDGSVLICSKNEASAAKAFDIVQGIIQDPEVGKIYTGTVKRIMDFGAFVEILPGKEGLLHISKISRQRVNKVTDFLNVGDTLFVKLAEIDRQGRLNLSANDIDDNGDRFN